MCQPPIQPASGADWKSTREGIIGRLKKRSGKIRKVKIKRFEIR